MVEIRCTYPREFKAYLIAKIEADLFRSAFCFRPQVSIFGKQYYLKSLLKLSYTDRKIYFRNSLLVKCLVYNKNYRFISDIISSYALNLDKFYLQFIGKK